MTKKSLLHQKTILVTGGTGSFGQTFIKYLLKKETPKSIRVYSRDELKQSEMRHILNNDIKLRFFIGDVRDLPRLKRACEGVDILIHAAALKQVPSCEYNPIEAIKTNIDGVINVIEACLDTNVKKIIALSTDKAVNPVNLYGATKLCAEKLFVQANSYRGNFRDSSFSVVRYGNVLDSRGSVIPCFKKQLELDKKIYITDKQMTRFWITLEQAVEFVLHSLHIMQGGEIFIPKISSMKIIDLAEVIAPQSPKKIIGIRPGEKLHEVLLTNEEARHAKEFKNYFIIEPEFAFWQKTHHQNGKKLPINFKYSSDSNKKWLTKKQLTEKLKNL